jgi:hypothetical protein
MSRLHEARRKILENKDQNKLQKKIYEKNWRLSTADVRR